MARVISRVIQFLAVLYFGLLIFVFAVQRRMIYQPTKGSQESMTKAAGSRGFQAWQNEAGQFIGWKHVLPLKREHMRLLIVHGNAGCAINRVDYANPLQLLEPVDVYILEYPGYGAREGSPSQASFFRAASEALDLLKKDGPVYIMGESLGTGVAAYLAGTCPESVQGMLLIAPYDSLASVAQAHLPIFPAGLLLRDRFPSATYLKNYHGPVAMLFAGRDVVVPGRFGHRLYDGYQGPKKFREVPSAGHNDLLDQPEAWWRELLAFWKAKGVGAE
jgi:pimeloyl-ACP methyl ester carboxylesterase